MFLSSASYPTIANVYYFFIEILEHLNSYLEKEDFSQFILASSLYQKLEYWVILDEASTIPTVLNPGTKLTLFTSVEKSNAAITKVKKELTSYEVFIPKQSLPAVSKTQNIGTSTKDYFRQLKRQRTESTAPQQETISVSSSNELERY